MNIRQMAAAVAAIGLAAALSSCSDDVPEAPPGSTDGSTAASTETSAPEGEIDADDVQKFFEALASNSVSELEQVTSLVAPGSLAELYLRHQTAVEIATRDGGTETKPDPLTVEDGTYESCSDASDPSTCAVWSDVTAENGKIAAFTTSGKSLKGRLLAGNGRKVKIRGLAEIRLVTAYEAASGNLVVALEIRNVSSSASIAVESRTAYRTAEGRQRSFSGQYGPPSIQADSVADVALFFPEAGLGGKVMLHLFDENGSMSGIAEIRIR